ncbi:NAD(P)H-quinone oxidoreductase subunit 5 [Prosthecobacter fusiformis]|uniref:Probable inorganic carbon transporter subunit DabB n=2 Tax=Prosthecobacter fusiformis TaxID=48464 RepID=A0A4R7S601_9BACT|nr:NAD(P)H-quinone oxidoreductase subunit 5 [Prosthecobacter fusiformis]
MNHLPLTTPALLEAYEWITPLLLLAVLAVSMLLRDGRQAAEGAAGVARLFFAVGLMFSFGVMLAGPMRIELAAWGPARLALLVDPLSALMLVLVSFLGVVVTRYAINYLDGDPGQARFSRWLVLALTSVLALVLSSNLLMFAAAWIATSLSLHQLLTFYRERPAAVMAARKKFVISRLADASMITALVLVWHGHGTWEFHELFANPAGPYAGLLAGFLVFAAMLKSAQFPFHSWLPDTLETPTPVSALMHAGIINAGGFLIVRLSPLVTQSPTALNTLALFGAFTALFASVIMMTQTSIKKSLAWSTVAQMGFMMLQCGLGAFALAMMHIVAHSLYKAHAFLSSGSVVNLAKSAWTPVGRPSAHPLVVLGSLAVSTLMGFCFAAALGVTLQNDPGTMLLIAVFIMAMAHLLWTLWSSSMRQRLILRGLGIVVAATTACFAVHAGFEHLLAASLPAYAPIRSGVEHAVMILVALLFLAVLIFQSQLPAWAARPAFARLYVHASNGFYIGTLFNRITGKFLF